MQEQATPFGTLSDLFSSTGTAPAREIENMELGNAVPVVSNPTEIDKRLTRWLCFVGDVISPKQKRERPDLVIGGEYFGQQYATLVRSKGLVRRYQLTPLETGYDFINDDVLGENTGGLQIVGTVQEKDENGKLLTGGPRLNVTPLHPGDEIKGIIHRENNSPFGVKGFVEVEVLRGVEFDTVKSSGIQEFLFNDWDKIMIGAKPVINKIKDARAHLEARKKETNETAFHSVIEAYLESCDRYERWGIDYLKVSAQLVRVPMHQGFLHTYSEQAELLFAQLDVTREDAIRMAADAPPLPQTSAAVDNSDVANALRQLGDMQVQVAQALASLNQPKADPPQEPVSVPVAPQAEPQPTHPDTAPNEFEAKADDKIEGKSEGGLEATLADGRPRCQTISSTTGEQCLQPAVGETGACAHPAHKKVE